MYMRKMGLPKRMFWIWSNICYGLFIGYALSLILNQTTGKEALGEEICFLSVPTMLLTTALKDAVYEDKINWKNYTNKKPQRLIPILVFTMGIGYGFLRNNSGIISLAAGFLITYTIILFIAISESNKPKDTT